MYPILIFLSTNTVPLLIPSFESIILIIVDLPTPFSPIRPILSLEFILKDTSFSICLSKNSCKHY